MTQPTSMPMTTSKKEGIRAARGVEERLEMCDLGISLRSPAVEQIYDT